MKPVRWSPLTEIEQMQRTIEAMFGDSFSLATKNLASIAPTDIYRRGHKLHVDVELPKFAENEINIEQDGKVINITAEHSEKSTDKKDYLQQETSEYLQRTLSLPRDADSENIKITFRNGVLKLEMPLLKIDTPKRLQIEK